MAKFEDVPLRRPLTAEQRQSIAAAQRAFDRALDVMRDDRSGDGIQQSVIDKYKQINPPQRGPVQ